MDLTKLESIFLKFVKKPGEKYQNFGDGNNQRELLIEFSPDVQHLKYPENLPHYDGLIFLTFDEIKKVLNSILLSVNWMSINGMYLTKDVSYYCDYCMKDIFEDYYYCSDCFKDMCYDCHTKNINTKICNEDHDLKLRKKLHLVYCDLCGETIYSDFMFSNCPFVPFYYNTYEVCIKCSSLDEGKELIEKHRLIKISNPIQYDNTDYKNMSDWIPIYKESINEINPFNGPCVICINCNTKSIYYGKVSIVTPTIINRPAIAFFNKSIQELLKDIQIIKLNISNNGIPYEYVNDDEFNNTLKLDTIVNDFLNFNILTTYIKMF